MSKTTAAPEVECKRTVHVFNSGGMTEDITVDRHSEGSEESLILGIRFFGCYAPSE